MTIAAAVPTWVQIPGNSSATVFAFPFKIFQATDLIVGFITATGYAQQTSGFTVPTSSIDVNGGGSITFTTPPPTGTTVDIRTQTPMIQNTEFANLGAFLPESHTEAFDRLTRTVQDLYRLAYTFGIHGPDQENMAWTALPVASQRKNNALMFDSNGLPTIGTLVAQALTQSLIGQFLYPQTAAEIAAGVTPTNYAYAPGDVRRYGVVGNNSADDTAAIQRAFNVGAQGQMIVFPSGFTCKTSSQLTYNAGPGILMETSTTCIAPTGSGYLALLIQPNASNSLFTHFSIRLEGNGNSLNGIYINNPKVTFFEHLIVNGFNGFGILGKAWWDSVFLDISCHSCGNTGTTNMSSIDSLLTTPVGNYAFSLVTDSLSNTTNETHIVRLQVEQANAQAIFIEPNTLSCVIDKIHSEQATPNVSFTTWQFGGNRCQYNTVRLNSNSPSANASAIVRGARWTVINMLAEGGIVVQANASGGTGTFIEPELQGTFGQQVGQTGRVKVFGGGIANYGSVPDSFVRIYDVNGPAGYNSGGINDVSFYSRNQNRQTGNYTLTLEDSRQRIQMAAVGTATLTIPANASVAFPVGTEIQGMNVGGGVLTIAITTDTLQLSPGGTTGSRSVAVNGSFTLWKIAATTWVIFGQAVT